jgi:hypothetical protein
MKFNYKISFQLSPKIFVLGWIWLLSLFACFGQTNKIDLTPWFTNKSFIWSDETNKLRTGVWRSLGSLVNEVDILVLSSTNAGLVYVYPPSGKIPKLELQDTNGLKIQPIKSKMDGKLPQRLSADDLRVYHSDGLFMGHGVKYKYLMLGRDAPHLLKEFTIGDVYEIKKEADYKLTVFPVIYKFETNGQYADRIDLPPVSVKIHLMPSQ